MVSHDVHFYWELDQQLQEGEEQGAEPALHSFTLFPRRRIKDLVSFLIPGLVPLKLHIPLCSGQKKIFSCINPKREAKRRGTVNAEVLVT